MADPVITITVSEDKQNLTRTTVTTKVEAIDKKELLERKSSLEVMIEKMQNQIKDIDADLALFPKEG